MDVIKYIEAILNSGDRILKKEFRFNFGIYPANGINLLFESISDHETKILFYNFSNFAIVCRFINSI